MDAARLCAGRFAARVCGAAGRYAEALGCICMSFRAVSSLPEPFGGKAAGYALPMKPAHGASASREQHDALQWSFFDDTDGADDAKTPEDSASQAFGSDESASLSDSTADTIGMVSPVDGCMRPILPARAFSSELFPPSLDDGDDETDPIAIRKLRYVVCRLSTRRQAEILVRLQSAATALLFPAASCAAAFEGVASRTATTA